ncbi:MAG: twin-arginine translocase TatA/TatE family subunit [Methylococcales bacterium]
MIGMWELLIILVIVIILFGTKRLSNLGSDLGTAIKGFRQSLNESPKEDRKDPAKLAKDSGQTIDVEVVSKDKKEI